MFYKKTNFRPHKAVRSFRDLEVYQRAMEGGIMVSKKILSILENKNYLFESDMVKCSLNIPRLIAEAHSSRFEEEKSGGGGLKKLDEAMKGCNEMVVYLEQVRDIYAERDEKIILEELIRRYINNRRKIFNLYKSWKKFIANNNKIN